MGRGGGGGGGGGKGVDDSTEEPRRDRTTLGGKKGELKKRERERVRKAALAADGSKCKKISTHTQETGVYNSHINPRNDEIYGIDIPSVSSFFHREALICFPTADLGLCFHHHDLHPIKSKTAPLTRALHHDSRRGRRRRGGRRYQSGRKNKTSDRQTSNQS